MEKQTREFVSNDRYFDELWEPVNRVITDKRLDYDAAATIGQSFGQLKREVRRLKRELSIEKGMRFSENYVSHLEDTIEQYEQALQFYGATESWKLEDPYEPRSCKVWKDQGTRARQEIERKETSDWWKK